MNRLAITQTVLLTLFLLMLTGSAVNGELTISKNNSSGTAEFEDCKLDFDIKLGDVMDYPDPGSSPIEFNLDIGNCSISIQAYRNESGIIYTWTVIRHNPVIITNLSKIEVNAVGVRFSNDTDDGDLQLCDTNFERTGNGKNKVKVKLSNDVPPNLVITESIVSDYKEPVTYSTALFIIVGSIVLIVALIGGILSIIGGTGFCFQRKNQEPPRNETATV